MDLKNLPEITFLDANLNKMLDEAIKIIEGILGRSITRADPITLLLKSFLSIILNQRLLIDTIAKDNLLFYSKGASLEHIGALVGVQRLPASKATVTVEIKLSAPRENSVTIKQGTRVTAGDGINFSLDESTIFLGGETVKRAKATCLEVGEIGNGYGVGELKIIVDPQPFLSEIINITASEGGADIESDNSLRERIRIAPESFSNAGSSGAYEFWTKKASSLISDVFVVSENPGEVQIYPLLEGGEIPGEEILQAVYDILDSRNIRPLTDKVFVKAPEITEYEIKLKYWISREAASFAAKIQSRAEMAIDNFIAWQKSKLGRDLNQTELYHRLRDAGVKRAEIFSPVFKIVPQNSIAFCTGVFAEYCGLEDD